MLRPGIPAAIQQRFGFVYRLLDNKYYMDWFNEHVLAARRASPGAALARRRCRPHRQHPDRRLGTHDRRHRALTRHVQSGYLYWYALVMIVGVIGLMTWQLWPFLGALLRPSVRP
jgi:NADH-quinone oxidoreductase subunit L